MFLKRAFSESDCEEGGGARDSSCALVTGPAGCGKTAAVYALAEELGLHVLEVNASSCRTGKQVTSMLLEATQSQQVRAGQAKLSFFKPKVEKPKVEEGRDEKKIRKALILFEHIDVVFEEQDRGFYSAVNSIAAATKRPIVFTSSDDNCLSLINKSIKARIEHFRFNSAISPPLVSSHLQLMCLTEGFFISRSSIQQVVSNCTSVSQAINRTQFLVESGHLTPVESEEAEEEIVRKPKKKFVLDKKVGVY